MAITVVITLVISQIRFYCAIIIWIWLDPTEKDHMNAKNTAAFLL